MIGQAGIFVGEAINRYSGIKEELQGQTKEELEDLITKLTPGINKQNAILGSGLTVLFSSIAGAAICDAMGVSKEYVKLPILYETIPSMVATCAYVITYGLGKGLDRFYQRDAATAILEERSGLENVSSQ